MFIFLCWSAANILESNPEGVAAFLYYFITEYIGVLSSSGSRSEESGTGRNRAGACLSF
jgi:hypothetical protein